MLLDAYNVESNATLAGLHEDPVSGGGFDFYSAWPSSVRPIPNYTAVTVTPGSLPFYISFNYQTAFGPLGSVGVVENATYGDATIWYTPEGSLWATVTATLAGIKDAIGRFDDFGHTLILGGSALSALGLAFPGITLPVFEMQVEMLTVGHAIADPIPDTYGVDPPLPLISPGGLISPEVANAINGWNASEQSLISLIRNMRTQVTNAQYAISQGDAPTATTLENELKAELSTLASSLRSQAIQLAAIRSELISSGVPDFSVTLAQITQILTSFEENGFPAEEISFFDDLGLTPQDIANLEASFGALNFDQIPESLYSALSDASQLPPGSSVPEPPMLGTFLFLLMLFGYRSRSQFQASKPRVTIN